METLPQIICSYCRRPVTTSFVTRGDYHWHATENSRGEKSDRACWEESAYGRLSLFPPDEPS